MIVGKNIPGGGISQHKGSEAGKNIVGSLETSRRPVSKRKSGRMCVVCVCGGGQGVESRGAL